MVESLSAPPPAAGLEEGASKGATTVGGSTPVSHFDEWAQASQSKLANGSLVDWLIDRSVDRDETINGRLMPRFIDHLCRTGGGGGG